jgi:hypothetical protein
VKKRWQPQIRAKAREKAATTGGIVIDTRARLGYTAPIGSTDQDRIRHLTVALPPRYAARLFDAGASDDRLWEVAADGLVGEGGPAWELWECLAGSKQHPSKPDGIGPVGAGKLLARRRPHLKRQVRHTHALARSAFRRGEGTPAPRGHAVSRHAPAMRRHSARICQSWLDPSAEGHWMTLAPSAVEASLTSAHQPLRTLTSWW